MKTLTSILDFSEISLFFCQFLPHVFWNCYLSTYTVVIVTSSWCIYSLIVRKCSSFVCCGNTPELSLKSVLSPFTIATSAFPCLVFLCPSPSFYLKCAFVVFKICLLMTEYILKVKSLSHAWLFATPWTVAYQDSPFIGWIFQARLLEWVAISFSKGSFQLRDQTQVSHIVGRRFTV